MNGIAVRIKGRQLPETDGNPCLLKELLRIGNSNALLIPYGFLKAIGFPRYFKMQIDCKAGVLTITPFKEEPEGIKLK